MPVAAAESPEYELLYEVDIDNFAYDFVSPSPLFVSTGGAEVSPGLKWLCE